MERGSFTFMHGLFLCIVLHFHASMAIFYKHVLNNTQYMLDFPIYGNEKWTQTWTIRNPDGNPFGRTTGEKNGPWEIETSKTHNVADLYQLIYTQIMTKLQAQEKQPLDLTKASTLLTMQHHPISTMNC